MYLNLVVTEGYSGPGNLFYFCSVNHDISTDSPRRDDTVPHNGVDLKVLLNPGIAYTSPNDACDQDYLQRYLI